MAIRLIAALTAASLASAASAALVITEVSPTGSSNSVATADWFELTNLGNAPVDITGYRIDDSSNDILLSQPLNGVTIIAPGESVIFLESAAGAVIPAFRTYWGQIATVQIGFYSGGGLGLSSTADGVNIFDASSTNIASVSFGASTTGVSFGYNTDTLTFGALSVVGQYTARLADGAVPVSIGSPGTVPAPAAAGLLALDGIAAGRRRR